MDLTVGVLAYMHEEVLHDLLHSIVDQQTDYAFETLVGVDACSDSTLEVARNFQKHFPEKIRLIEHSVNIGGNANYIDLINRASGRFMIIHDGDDVMLPGKLQKMCRFLEDNPECELVTHPMVRATNDLSSLSGECDYNNLPETFGLDLLVARRITFGNSQKMFRMPIRLPESEETIDFGFDIAHVGFALVGYIDEPLGIKRDFQGSVSKSQGAKFGAAILATLEAFDSSLPFLEDEKVVILAKERFLVACLSGFAMKGDAANFNVFIQYFDEHVVGEYWLARAISALAKFSLLRWQVVRLLGFAHSSVTRLRREKVDPTSLKILEEQAERRSSAIAL